MKRLTIVLGVIMLAAVAARCGSSNSSTPTQPSNTVVFTVQLLPSNEAPTPVSNSENVARGTAVITVHKDTNAIDFAVSVNSFPAGSALILSHIHGPSAPAGTAASVYVDTLLTAGTAPALVNGAATYNLTNSTTADKIAAILANPSQFYFNVHSTLNPGGVMRGQLQ